MSDINRKPLVDKPYVEIGGIRWATMNIGANSETDYGLYFQWGDTAGYASSQCGSSTTANKKPFYYQDCVLHNGTSNTGATSFTKYNLSTDTKTKLDETDDAAVANWGGSWRIPTREEWVALGNATIFIDSGGTEITSSDKRTVLSGITGIYLQDKEDSSKKLFLPAVGFCNNGSVYEVGSGGYYWSSSLNSSSVSYSYYMSFFSSSVNWQNNYLRHYGYSVRPIQNVYKDISITLTGDEVSNITLTLINREGVSYTAVTDENGTVEFSQVLGGNCTLSTDSGTLYTNTIIVDSSTSSFTIELLPYEYVEIGGLKWAKCNIGAENETDYGLYFQWGDISGYTASQVGSGSGQKYFGWADYKYGDGTSSPDETSMTKYNSTDGKTVLEASDDAAHINMGSSWRMPTTAEWAALRNAVNIEHITGTTGYKGSGVKGLLCTDKTDSSKTLFFPAAGYCDYGYVNGVGSHGYYCSSSLHSGSVVNAYSMGFISSNMHWQDSNERYRGLSVRAVLAS